MQKKAFLVLGLAAAFCFEFRFNGDNATKQRIISLPLKWMRISNRGYFP